MKVSVVVALYNTGPHLRDLVRSLDAQTMPAADFEVVLVDDGSTDDTLELARRLAAERSNVVVETIPNSGWPGRPRNVGLDRARGDYVFFSDHDDMFAPRALERMHAVAVQNSSDVVDGTSVRRGRDTPYCSVWAEDVPVADPAGPAITSRTVHKLFRRAFLVEHGIRFREGRIRLEDHEFMARVLSRRPVISILASEPCYVWIHRSDGTNSSDTPIDPAVYWGFYGHVLEVWEQEAGPGPLLDAARAIAAVQAFSRFPASRYLKRAPKSQTALFQAVHTVFARHVPAELDARFPVLKRLRIQALRTGDQQWFTAVQQWRSTLAVQFATEEVALRDGRLVVTMTGRCSVAGGGEVPIDWSGAQPELVADERLRGSAADRRLLPADAGTVELTIRHRTSGVEWPVPGQRSTVGPGLTVRTEAEVDLRHDAFGGELERGIWDLWANVQFLGETVRRRVAPPAAGLPREVTAGLTAYFTTVGRLSFTPWSRVAASRATRFAAARTRQVKGRLRTGYRRGRRLLGRVRNRLDRHPVTHLRLPRQPAVAAEDLRRLDRHLDPVHLRRLVVLVPGRATRAGTLFARHYPSAEILVLDTSGLGVRRRRPHPRVAVARTPTITAIHNAVSALPEVTAIVDATAGPTEQRAGLLRHLLFQLAEGGRYVMTAPDRGLRELLDQWQRLRSDPALREREGIHEDEGFRAAAVESVTADGPVVVLGKTGRHALKLRDEPARTVLPARFGAGWGRELDHREPVAVSARGTAWANRDRDTFRTTLDVPRLYLREYRDVICAPRQLVVKDGVMLPVSFHHGLRKRLVQASPLVQHADGNFAVLDPSVAAVAEADPLPGAYFHFDSEFPGHFGHLMTEDVSKLWGWPAAKAAHPGLKVLLSTTEPGGAPGRAHRAVLSAWGVPADDIVCIDRPMRVEVLVGASPMFYNGRYAHPELTDVWDRLRDALRAQAPAAEAADPPRRIFVARPPRSLRPCRNRPEVEALFTAHGFAIVHPEKHSLAEQAQLFAGADVVAGFGGSGLFNTIFSSRPGRRIVIASEQYTARNEWTIAAAKGDDYHHFLCPAEVQRQGSAYESRAFHSAFSFDFARDGAALEALLKD